MHFYLHHAAIVIADIEFGHFFPFGGLEILVLSQWFWEIEKAMENFEWSSSLSGFC
jgi:hypothetical protein